MTIYRSKIGFGIVAPVILITGVLLLVSLMESDWIVFLIGLAITLFVIHLFFTTYYVVDGPILKIKAGYLYNKELSISSIVKLEETTRSLSAPAISLDRLEVFYNRFDSIIISPENKKDFIKQLCGINPEIIVKLKPT